MIVIGQFSRKTSESFAEISPAMNKNDGRIGARRKEPAIGRRQAAEHSVRRCHCGQSDMDAARPAICQKTMREGHCGLGLSGAGHILDDEKYWPVRKRDLFTEELQRCWLVDVGKQRFHTPKGSRLCRNEAGLPDRALRHWSGDIAPIAHKFVEKSFTASRRREFEPIAVRAEPIRQHGEPGQSKRQSRDGYFGWRDPRWIEDGIDRLRQLGCGKLSRLADLDLAIYDSRDTAAEIQCQGFAVMPKDTLENLLPFRRKQSQYQLLTQRGETRLILKQPQACCIVSNRNKLFRFGPWSQRGWP